MMTPDGGRPTPPNYDLDPVQLSALESELVDDLRKGACGGGITAVWIASEHPYANIIRTHEGRLFPEVHDSSAGDESKTLFLALVDTRTGSGGVVHGATVCCARSLDEGYGDSSAVDTGFIVIDSLIELGNFSAIDFECYYAAEDVDLTRCVSVETNFRIGQRVTNAAGLSTSTLAYLMFFRFMVRRGARPNRAVIFGDMNGASRISLQRNRMPHVPLMGRTDLVTPEAALGRSSLPIAIPVDDAFHDLFGTMQADVPEVFLGVDTVLFAAAHEALLAPVEASL